MSRRPLEHLAALLLLAQSSVCCNDRLNPQAQAGIANAERV